MPTTTRLAVGRADKVGLAMGWFRLNKRQEDNTRPAETTGQITVTLCEGSTPLEVVGESYRQDNLWRLVGGFKTEYVQEPCIAMLLPEDNPHDPNAIAVHISGLMVGYLARSTAAAYRPGLEALMKKHGHVIALNGHIIGGGQRDDGIGRLGVFLEHDPEDFVIGSPQPKPEPEPEHLRTGAHAEADGGRLSWINDLPDDDIRAIPQLRKLLTTETNPGERHYMYSQLEHHLYHSRDAFSSALSDYDAVCRDHDAEMDAIKKALIADLGGLPLLEIYKQAAIRHQHAHDYETALWWAERGLEVYGEQCLDAEWTDDLAKRADKFRRALNPEPKPPRPREPRLPAEPVIETLTCVTCGSEFDRIRARGRKPTQCAACHGENPVPAAIVHEPADEPELETESSTGSGTPHAET
jgi:hypothetical protein